MRSRAFTVTEVARAAAGARKAGLSVSRIEIDRAGKIVIICGDAPPPDGEGPKPENPNGWEARLAEAMRWAQ